MKKAPECNHQTGNYTVYLTSNRTRTHMLLLIFSSPVQIRYLTPKRQNPAVAHKGLTDPQDLWALAEAPD